MTSVVPDSQLDNDIGYLRHQVEALERRRSALSATLLSSQHIIDRIQRARTNDQSPTSPASSALDMCKRQRKRNLQSLYRRCAGITAFRVQDPDPCAVDNGKLLGVCIDVHVKGQPVDPYYLLLHKPSPTSDALRIHKHTIPPCIPLKALSAKHLPQPAPLTEDQGSSKSDSVQSLHTLVRELRKELVSYHLRLHAVSKIRKDARLPNMEDGENSPLHEAGELDIVDVKALDASAREIGITWKDGSTARIAIFKDGKVEKAVHRTELGESRKRQVERSISGGNGSVEGVMERLLAGTA
ncbi:Cenp-O kinetochore centromere component-domain-containing protein [Phyllosticta citribraziliensis]|uniref:Cenp-O kinetochore centromere component-domain-containing protein n=1 Tax=Phyllosticta citribraziliensis TaxID=989973 RepID=A0ABR1LPH8_9PEZI